LDNVTTGAAIKKAILAQVAGSRYALIVYMSRSIAGVKTGLNVAANNI
jgi:hypothetical protein